MTEWHPIESVPKNGDHFLGFDKINNRIYECWMMVSREGRFYAMTYQTTAQYEITHWMPLPELPRYIKKTCVNQIWSAIHEKDGIFACPTFLECGYKEVNYCPICGESQ